MTGLKFVRARVSTLRASVMAALYYDNTRPMRYFIMLASLLESLWLLLPGESISTVSTVLFKRIFTADEYMAPFPFFVFAIKLLAEAWPVTWLKRIAASSAAIWWLFMGICALLSRFNSVAGGMWLLIGIFAVWVLWRFED